MEPDPDPVAISAALARAATHLSNEKTSLAATKAFNQHHTSPWKLDHVDHWEAMPKLVAAARERLQDAQQRIRLVAAEATGNYEPLHDVGVP